MIIHTVSSYEEDLNFLTISVCEMGKLLLDILEILHETIQNKDQLGFQQAQTIDRTINELDAQIEGKAESLIVLRQPMSIDLRQIISSLKAAVIIERMGDLAKNTVKRVTKTDDLYLTDVQDDLDQILEILKKMLSNALQAYNRFDEKLALTVCIEDKKIDALYKLILTKLQNKITKQEANIESILQAIFAIKNIERIGDYISKIAQLVPYITKGKKVTKHEIKQYDTKDFI
jgi:phosphate transport system protein